MDQTNLSLWTPYLQSPLVFAGFSIMLIVGIITTLLKKNIFSLSKSASERVIKKVLLYSFLLGVLTIAVGFELTLKKVRETHGRIIQQETQDEQSPAVVGTDVNITYGDPKRKEKRAYQAKDGVKKVASNPSSTSGNIEQKTIGKQSPAVVSNGNVTIKYNNRDR